MLKVKMEGGIQGMVIVFSACMIQVLAFGNYACVGIYTLYLLEEFPEDTVGVSLISSIHFALLLGCGPLISFLMTKVSYRKLSILGALLVFVGILCTPLLIHLPALYLFFGVFAGLGGCFIYLPSHVLSGLYYDKYRSLSTGVATSGTGLGAILMPLIVSNLIEEYSWKGSLLILAGLDFHLLIFALLMLPPPTPPSVTKCTKDDDYRMSELHSQKDLSNDKAVKLSGADRSGASTLYEPLTNDTGYNYDYSEKTEENHRLLLSIAEDEQCNFEINHQESSHHSNNKKNEENSVKQKLRAYNSVPDDDISMVFQPSYLSWATNLSVRGSRLYDSFPSFLHETDIGTHSENNFPVSNKFNGKLTQKMQINPETIKHKTLKETLKHHFLLFINFKFLIYFISTILWSLSTIIFITFGPELFVLKGLSKYDAAIVFTFFGVGQLLGCIFISILGSCVGKRVFLYILSNSLTGFFIGIAPLYDSYAWIVMVCLCSGLAYGGILGLYMIVMVDIVGVDDMEIGLGYIMLASGIGCFAGPPLGGYLKEIYYDYNYSFYLAGVFAVVAGLCMVFIYLKCCKEKELKEEYV
ncbi:monocarboxylate transporter 12-B-like isoform X2 [Biomphalaria glabrata]|uniref:Monocarboxylate transporter 12-B-like isoform X2 n=1 Tax=Biomphalaria glabrata TaxID=6526 RepID=A0A9W2ZPC4_BIOGL|nr:monocarboxylate transporter 12-B-like isoform X2 [Biomphalaria glabrata]XP_055876886.1 monocarboxylate transporter 12-B-like isoform X2 [Biomphalaria glabrata]XP_055876887.1 monocarboxylate transporter 12-B-like isoform X2 [Biomphalaria glabrata]